MPPSTPLPSVRLVAGIHPQGSRTPTYLLCLQCDGAGVCPHCNGRATETNETCPCWWWEERGFDEAFRGRCGDCKGSGVIELHECFDLG